jgi:CBS domain-containing protein
MLIADLYTAGALDIAADETIAEAAIRLRENDVSSLAVMDGEQLVGIVTERDIVQATADGANPRRTAVQAYMATEPVTASPDEDTVVVAARMLDSGVRHLPVVTGGRVVGMISVRDLVALESLPGWAR